MNAYNVLFTPICEPPCPVMSDFFNAAYRRARSRFTTEQWLALPPQQVTEAIYQAMREMDAAAAVEGAVQPETKPTPDDDRADP